MSGPSPWGLKWNIIIRVWLNKEESKKRKNQLVR